MECLNDRDSVSIISKKKKSC